VQHSEVLLLANADRRSTDHSCLSLRSKKFSTVFWSSCAFSCHRSQFLSCVALATNFSNLRATYGATGRFLQSIGLNSILASRFLCDFSLHSFAFPSVCLPTRSRTKIQNLYFNLQNVIVTLRAPQLDSRKAQYLFYVLRQVSSLEQLLVFVPLSEEDGPTV